MYYGSNSSWIIQNNLRWWPPKIILSGYKEKCSLICSKNQQVVADCYWEVGLSNPTQMAELRYGITFQDLSFSSFITNHMGELLMISGLKGREYVWDGIGVHSIPAGILVWPWANYLSQDFISSLGGIMIKYVKMPSTEPIHSNSVPPWAPVSGLREIRPAIG